MQGSEERGPRPPVLHCAAETCVSATGGAYPSGIAAFPRRPIAFLWHYIRRRPLLHFSALASVLLAASCACAAQYGLKMIVDAMAQGIDHIAVAWRALAVFAGLLAVESLLWRSGSWLGYRAILVDKAEAKLDLFSHLGGHSSRYFTDLLSGSLANRISSTGDAAQQTLSIVLFNMLRYAPIFARRWSSSPPSGGALSSLLVSSCWWPQAPWPFSVSAAQRAPRLRRTRSGSRRCPGRCRLQHLGGKSFLRTFTGASAVRAAAE